MPVRGSRVRSHDPTSYPRVSFVVAVVLVEAREVVALPVRVQIPAVTPIARTVHVPSPTVAKLNECLKADSESVFDGKRCYDSILALEASGPSLTLGFPTIATRTQKDTTFRDGEN